MALILSKGIEKIKWPEPLSNSEFNHGQNGQDGHFEATWFEEKIYRKVEEVEEVKEEGKKK